VAEVVVVVMDARDVAKEAKELGKAEGNFKASEQ